MLLSLLAIVAVPDARSEGTNQAYPIDLPTALRLAGAQNLDIQIAKERLKEAKANHSSAVERFFPWISPGVGYHRRDGLAQAVPDGTIFKADYQSYYPGVTLAGQMDLGDAIYKSLAAKQLVKAADQALEAERQDTILTTARAYFDLARAGALVDVANATLNTSKDYEKQLQQAVTIGIAFKGDELRVQTQTKQFQISLRQAIEQERVAAVELARILHLDSRVALVPQDTGLLRLAIFDPKLSMDEAVGRALRFRPELKQSQALLAAFQQNKNGALYGPLIPSLSGQAFGGALGGGSNGGPSNFGAIGDYQVGVGWRIGPGGLFDSGRIHASEAQLNVEQLRSAKLKDDITAEVVADLTRLQSLSDQIELAESKLDLATETLRVTSERKQFGVGAVLEDLQAQQDLDRARSDYVNVLAEYNKAQYSLGRALGSTPGAEIGLRH